MLNVDRMTVKDCFHNNAALPVVMNVTDIDANDIKVIKEGTRVVKDVPILMMGKNISEHRWIETDLILYVKYISMYGIYAKIASVKFNRVLALDKFNIQKPHLIVERKPYTPFYTALSIIEPDGFILRYIVTTCNDTLDCLKLTTEDMEIDVTEDELYTVLAHHAYKLESRLK